mmetsp:Transcript_17929/g.19431  ORF Transcript_17929/g.19431 Transcript_17929/m.19431 type:complete len:347 (-) Transcript_17929:12-1052(-)
MLKTVKTILTKVDERHQERHNNGQRPAHFVNGYMKRERKKKRKELEEDEGDSNSSNSRGVETTLTYHLMYIPRILKNDLRRQYPIMFANVYNSCDYDFMMKFIHQFCDLTGHVKITDTYAPNGPSSMLIGEAQGVESCVQMWAFHMNDAPDLCFRLQSIRIRVRSDGTSTCEGKYIYSGTAIIYVNPKKIPKILNSCKVNENGILVLPNVPSPGIFIKQTLYPTIEDQENTSSSSSNDELLANELNELFEIDQQLLSEFVYSLQGEEKNENSFTEISSSLDEESEYLFSVFTDLMNPARSAPRMPDLEEILPLGFPYEYDGDISFHLNEESKIYSVDLKSNLRNIK